MYFGKYTYDFDVAFNLDLILTTLTKITYLGYDFLRHWLCTSII